MDADELRRRREALGLSLDQLAALLGRTGPNRRQTLSQWERGEKRIPPKVLPRLRAVLRREERRQDRQRKRLRALLPSLTDRQRQVATLRYGLENGLNRTLEEVAGDLGLTKQRVAEVEEAVLKRLKG